MLFRELLVVHLEKAEELGNENSDRFYAVLSSSAFGCLISKAQDLLADGVANGCAESDQLHTGLFNKCENLPVHFRRLSGDLFVSLCQDQEGNSLKLLVGEAEHVKRRHEAKYGRGTTASDVPVLIEEVQRHDTIDLFVAETLHNFSVLGMEAAVHIYIAVSAEHVLCRVHEGLATCEYRDDVTDVQTAWISYGRLRTIDLQANTHALASLKSFDGTHASDRAFTDVFHNFRVLLAELFKVQLGNDVSDVILGLLVLLLVLERTLVQHFGQATALSLVSVVVHLRNHRVRQMRQVLHLSEETDDI